MWYHIQFRGTSLNAAKVSATSSQSGIYCHHLQIGHNGLRLELATNVAPIEIHETCNASSDATDDRQIGSLLSDLDEENRQTHGKLGMVRQFHRSREEMKLTSGLTHLNLPAIV